MELHHLGVGDVHAGACRHGHRCATDLRRVGRGLEQVPIAAGSQHHGPGKVQRQPPRAVDRESTDDATVVDAAHQIDRRRVLAYGNARTPNGRLEQGAHDLRTGGVAVGVHDAPGTVPGLASEHQVAGVVGVEVGAEAAQPLHDPGSGPGDDVGRVPVADASRHVHRVFGVVGRGVSPIERCGQATLGPGARTATKFGVDQHRRLTDFEGNGQGRDSGTHHQDAMAFHSNRG